MSGVSVTCEKVSCAGGVIVKPLFTGLMLNGGWVLLFLVLVGPAMAHCALIITQATHVVVRVSLPASTVPSSNHPMML